MNIWYIKEIEAWNDIVSFWNEIFSEVINGN